MPVAGVYCRKCNTLIPSADVQAGKIVRVGRLVYCRRCSREIEAAAEDSKILDIRAVTEAETKSLAVGISPEAAAGEAGEDAPPPLPATDLSAEALAKAEAPPDVSAAAPEEAAAAPADEPQLPSPGEEPPIVVIPPARTGVQKHWVAAIAALGIAIGAGVVYGVLSRRGPAPAASPAASPAAPVAPQAAAPGAAPAVPSPLVPGRDRAELRLSEWAGEKKAQAPVRLFLVDNEAKTETPLQLKDSYPFAGKYQLLFQRPGYEDQRADVDLTGAAPVPPLKDILEQVAFRPAAELQQAYREGREKLGASDFDGAVAALRAAADLDAGFSPSPEEPTAGRLLQDAQDGITRLKEAAEWETKGGEAIAEGNGEAVEAAAREIEKRVGEKHERAERLRRAMTEAAGVASRVAQALDAGNPEEAQRLLEDLQVRTPRGPLVKDYQGQLALFQQERERIQAFLASLSSAFDRNSPAAYVPVIAPESGDLRAALQDVTLRFVRAGGRFVSNRHELLGGIRFRDQGRKARVRVQRQFEYRIGQGRPLKGQPIEMVYHLAKVEDGWRLEGVGE